MARGTGRKNEGKSKGKGKGKGTPTDKGTGKAKAKAERERTGRMEKDRAVKPLENAPTPRGAPHMQRKGVRQQQR
jgi:hypothetical protein